MGDSIEFGRNSEPRWPAAPYNCWDYGMRRLANVSLYIHTNRLPAAGSQGLRGHLVVAKST